MDKRVTHGGYVGGQKPPLLSTYANMIGRCNDPRHAGYKHYGAKGVTVCQEWQNSFAAFQAWAISNGWEPGKQLDKDILAEERGMVRPFHYTPDTCQWVDQATNARYSSSRDRAGQNKTIKVSPDQAQEMIARYHGENPPSQRALAKEYGISQFGVRYILKTTKPLDL